MQLRLETLDRSEALLRRASLNSTYSSVRFAAAVDSADFPRGNVGERVKQDEKVFSGHGALPRDVGEQPGDHRQRVQEPRLSRGRRRRSRR